MKPPRPERPALVVVVEDDAALRDALGTMLRTAKFSTALYESAEDFIDADRRPDCVLLDIRLPGLDGIATLRWVVEHLPSCAAIVLTGHGDIPTAVSAVRIGAFDFIEKPFDPDHLLRRIVEAIATARERGRRTIDTADLRRRYLSLTPREVSVMGLVCRGMSNKAMAIHLDISPRTIEVYRANAMEKMGAATLADLVRVSVLLELGGC